jgi:hypothetical protein
MISPHSPHDLFGFNIVFSPTENAPPNDETRFQRILFPARLRKCFPPYYIDQQTKRRSFWRVTMSWRLNPFEMATT